MTRVRGSAAKNLARWHFDEQAIDRLKQRDVAPNYITLLRQNEVVSDTCVAPGTA